MAKYSSETNCKKKKRYTNKQELKAALEKIWETEGSNLRLYQCSVCKGWHLTDIHYG